MYQYPYGNAQQLNLDWILSKIQELEAGSGGGGADLEEVANALVSASFDAGVSYRRYDYCFYNGKLYRALNDTSGAFNPADWLEVVIGDDIPVLTRLLNAVDASLTTLQGQVADLDSDDVDNASNVTGTTVTDALDNLNGAITQTYVVDVNGGGDYTSLTACLLVLKDDKKEKIIKIKSGTYNIYNEYVASNVPIYTGSSPSVEYYDYCVWIPDNTSLIGEGIVKIVWQPTSSQVTAPQSKTVSPLNIAGNCYIENVEVYCKNGRYCIHDDPYKPSDVNVAKSAWGAKHHFKNVRCYKQANDGSLGNTNIVGIGVHKGITYIYDNCFFDTEIAGGFYAHTNTTDGGITLQVSDSNLFTFNNCIFQSTTSACLSLRNTATQTLEEMAVFNNCSFDNKSINHYTANITLIELIDSSYANPHARNAWQVILNGCTEGIITIDDTNNTFSPIIVDSIPTKSAYEFITPDSTNVSSQSAYIQKNGGIATINGNIQLNGSVSGFNGSLGTFSTIKPKANTRFPVWATYNNTSGIYNLQLNATGELVTQTGSGTLTGQILFINAIIFL